MEEHWISLIPGGDHKAIINNPIGVSTFHYTELADDMKAALPSVEALQNELISFER